MTPNLKCKIVHGMTRNLKCKIVRGMTPNKKSKIVRGMTPNLKCKIVRLPIYGGITNIIVYHLTGESGQRAPIEIVWSTSGIF